MKNEKKELLREAMNYCDENEKSTEFMIEFMKDRAGATHEEVMTFLACPDANHKE